MYSFLISLAIALIIGCGWALLGLWETWAMGTWLGIAAFIASWFIIGRIIKKRIEPAILHAQKQAESGKAQLALQTFESLLPLGNWQPLLKGQLYAQMGILCASIGDEKKGLEFLQKSSARFADAQMFLAAMHARGGDSTKAIKVLENCEGYNKKHILLHNLHAYLLEKQDKRSEAIAVLNKLLKNEKSNEITKDNLLRLQNNKKLNMKRFGMTWYALQLEKPPAGMGQQRAARPGFRQKGKRRK